MPVRVLYFGRLSTTCSALIQVINIGSRQAKALLIMLCVCAGVMLGAGCGDKKPEGIAENVVAFLREFS